MDRVNLKRSQLCIYRVQNFKGPLHSNFQSLQQFNENTYGICDLCIQTGEHTFECQRYEQPIRYVLKVNW